MSWNVVRFSKFLSLVLRHAPHRIGITLDEQGWADVEALLSAANHHHVPLTRELLEVVVRDNYKQRFALSDDGRRIRANQGHSLPVDLGLSPVEPPLFLYHGTAARSLEAIRREGLVPGRRNYVHLSPDRTAAESVGRRHGPPVVLTVKAGDMFGDGYDFFLSANVVWLTARVPATYLLIPEPPR